MARVIRPSDRRGCGPLTLSTGSLPRVNEGVMNIFTLKTILFEACILICVSIIGALLFNHLRPNGMVLWDRLNAAQDALVPSPSMTGDSGADAPVTVAKDIAQAPNQHPAQSSPSRDGALPHMVS